MNDVYLVFWQDEVYGNRHLVNIFGSKEEAWTFIILGTTNSAEYTVQCWKVKEKWYE